MRDGLPRRRFVGSLAALAAGPWLRSRPSHAIVIRGGLVVDGTGTPGREADVAVDGGRVARIGRVSERGVLEIDGRGLVVSPGFVDIHSHADSGLRQDTRAESLIRQGVTTVVVGADGSSRWPVDDLLRDLDGAAVNVATMVGLGRVRQLVVGDGDRPATASQLARMRRLVEQALASGAVGASAGLEYTPGAFASRQELEALCRPLARRGLPFAPHLRNEDDRLLDAIEEAIAVARGAGCPLHIAHLKTLGPRNWWKLDQVFTVLEAAAASGLAVTFDRYPYVAYQTGLTSLFPVSARDGGNAALLARLADPASRPALRDAVEAKVDLLGGWDRVMISNVPGTDSTGALGKRVPELIVDGKSPFDTVVDLLTRYNAAVGMVGFGMSEPNLERILSHPLGMVASDGGAVAVEGPTRAGHPHPRALGTFARVLGHYVRERRVLGLEDAVRRMSAMPAARAGVRARGRLRVGGPADVAVFDPGRIIDHATFEAPFAYAEGVRAVLVNGQVAWHDGERTSTNAGRSLRARTP